MKAMSGKRVSIILPALNEEDTIGRIIDEIRGGNGLAEPPDYSANSLLEAA